MSLSPENDRTDSSLILIRQAKAGDAEALNALFDRYSARVLQIVRLRLGPSLRAKLESQDIVQDAFTRAVNGFDHFELRHEGAFIHWLGELVRNAINDRYDQFRAQKRDMRQENPIEANERTDSSRDFSLPGDDPTPSRVLENREDVLRLSAAMDKLSQDARDVIVFRDLEELSFAEIGRLTGRSEDAARMYYSRSKAQLAGIFQAM
ncbi:MAG: sigma-70 family RNA polymerase sigma factor [Elusimicrobia bacterium]|nr:sigma-70 family RNA polymerase sigma factor [Elusimicrobiota bacterium]